MTRPPPPSLRSDLAERRSRHNRLVAAVLAPVLALIAFSAYVVQEKLETYRSSAELMSAAQLVRSAQALARELQNERALAALYVGTGRTSWRPEVEDQRQATDDRRDAFREVISRPQSQQLFGRERPDFGLGLLDTLRAGVDDSADTRQVLEGYSLIVNQVISASSNLSAGNLGNLVAAYIDLGHIKDRLARQRSVGTSWLLTGRTDRELLDLFLVARAEMRAFAQSFRSYASQAQREAFDQLMRGPIVEEVDRLHARALAGQLTPSDADAWQRSHMALLAQLNQAEERLADEMEAGIRDKLSAAKTTFYVIVVVVLGLVLFSLETLRRSERRAALAEEEARKLFRAVEQSPVSVMITDPNGLIEYVNPDFTRMTGFSREEVIGRNPRILKAGTTSPEAYADLWKTISSGQEWRGELCNRRKNGTHYWEYMTIAPVKGADGKVINFIAMKEDITEVKTLRLALEREHANIRRILETMQDGIALIDAEGNFQYVNPALESEFGPVAGRSCQDYFGETIAPRPVSQFTVQTRWEWLSRRTGKVYELTALPVQGADGSLSHLQIFHDITVRKQAEEALNTAREAAEMANRAKSEFLATMSHELRTPLNAIIGFSEIIEGQLLGPVGQQQYVEYAHDINESGRHLLGLINDILDVARLDVGRIALREQETDVTTLVRAGLTMVRERAEANNIALSCDIPRDFPALWADERRVKQVLVNVLGNAVKFTPAGGKVSVTARVTPAGGIDIVVTDTGIGMNPEDIPKMMAPFAQVETSLSRRYEGSGLGLPLSLKLMELHNGGIHIDSEPGEGTTVTLSFPPERTRSLQPA